MPKVRKDVENSEPESAPAFYKRARKGDFRVGDTSLTYEAAGGAFSIKSRLEPGDSIVEVSIVHSDGRPDAGMLGLAAFQAAFGFSPSEGQVCDGRTKDGESVTVTVRAVRKVTRAEATHSLHGGKVPGWGTSDWNEQCKEADESLDPTDTENLGRGHASDPMKGVNGDPLREGLGLPDPFSENTPSLSTLVKRKRADARRRAHGHPKDSSKTFVPKSMDTGPEDKTPLRDRLLSQEKSPAEIAIIAEEARRIRDALDAFAAQRPANAGAVERWLEGISREEAARRHPPATPRAVEKAGEKLGGLVSRLRLGA